MPGYTVLKKRGDFVRLTRCGDTVSTKTLVVQAIRSNLPKRSRKARVGYTTTKKIGKAHIRNRCRRRLRAAAALWFRKYSMPNFDYAIIARYNTAEADFEELCKDLVYALKKIRRKIRLEDKIRFEERKHEKENAENAVPVPD
ncbi:MAG: ribonuclease P protein component [Alphaproteobacteria bacterium]|nr:ribonuclease P protein component [Alphaproteobacteria bacterium]